MSRRQLDDTRIYRARSLRAEVDVTRCQGRWAHQSPVAGLPSYFAFPSLQQTFVRFSRDESPVGIRLAFATVHVDTALAVSQFLSAPLQNGIRLVPLDAPVHHQDALR